MVYAVVLNSNALRNFNIEPRKNFWFSSSIQKVLTNSTLLSFGNVTILTPFGKLISLYLHKIVFVQIKLVQTVFFHSDD